MNDWLTAVDWQRLSPRSRETLETLIPLVQDGFGHDEIGKQVGLSGRQVGEALGELRAEATAQVRGAQLHSLSEDELSGMRESLERYGQLVPILTDEKGHVLDGHNRKQLLEELGLPVESKVIDLSGQTFGGIDRDQARHEIGLTANIVRRQLSREARRAAIEAELVHDPGRSDRLIAGLFGIANHTVASVRRELEERGTVRRLAERVGRDGTRQPAKKRPLARPTAQGPDGNGRATSEPTQLLRDLRLDETASLGNTVVFAGDGVQVTLTHSLWSALGLRHDLELRLA